MKKMILLLGSFLLVLSSFSQNIEKELKEINTLIDSSLKEPKKSRFITMSALDSIITKKLYQIGGSGIKDGSFYGLNTTITEKEANIGASLAMRSKKDNFFFIQPIVKVKNEDGAINLVKDGELKNEYSFGTSFLFNLPSFSSAFYNDKRKIVLHNQLRIQKILYEENLNRRVYEIDSLLAKTKKSFTDINNNIELKAVIEKLFNNSEHLKPNIDCIKKFEELKENLMQLVKLNILSDSIFNNDYKNLEETINAISINDIKSVLTNSYIKKQNEIQVSETHAKAIHWLRVSVNYNSQNLKLADNNSLSKPYDFLHEYFTVGIFWNRQSIKKTGCNHYWSAGVEYSSSRNFDSDNLKSIQVTTPTTINGITGNSVTTYSFFDKKPNRANQFNARGIYSFFNPDTNYGLEFTARAGVNNINNNDREVTIGVFIPVGTSEDGSAILVQPNLNFSRLFNKKSDVFWQDNFSFGILLSANISKLGRKRD